MEIRLSIPDQKMPEFPKIPDYSKQFSELIKSINDSKREALLENMKAVKEIIKEINKKDESKLERQYDNIERVLGKIPEIIKDTVKSSEKKNEFAGLEEAIRKNNTEIVSAIKSNKGDGISSAIRSLERRMEMFSLPKTIVVESKQRVVPYPM